MGFWNSKKNTHSPTLADPNDPRTGDCLYTICTFVQTINVSYNILRMSKCIFLVDTLYKHALYLYVLESTMNFACSIPIDVPSNRWLFVRQLTPTTNNKCMIQHVTNVQIHFWLTCSLYVFLLESTMNFTCVIPIGDPLCH